MTVVTPSSEAFLRTRPQKSAESGETTPIRGSVRRNDGGFRRDVEAERQLAVWCPDWPVVAAAAHHGLSSELPLAVFERGEVFACSATARVEGVRTQHATPRCLGALSRVDRCGPE
jgi:protein ImuB